MSEQPTLPELPPLPSSDYDYMHDYYEGWTAVGPTPKDRYGEIELFTAESMRAFGAECARLATERAAKVCESLISQDTDWDTSYWNQAVSRCSFAIRAQGE